MLENMDRRIASILLGDRKYSEMDGKLFFIKPVGDIDSVKVFLKKFPRIYETLIYVTTTIFFYGMSAEEAMRKAYGDIRDRKIIVNLGSGTSDFAGGVINVDAFPYPSVNIVADATRLPFKDASVDMVISESMLEHVPLPERAIAEMRRIIKPGGYLYLELPFMYPYHASPKDFTRFTIEGLSEELGDSFEIVAAGARSGPFSALIIQAMYALSLLLSLGSKRAYSLLLQICMVALAPLKVFDFFYIPLEDSHEAASHIYFFAKKRR
ncbi:MAG: class I SAM-dependent methyltransferase [Candidatus Vogelbacteria bacterium]|nr:class I SAM-dependent methyltransferase [Candidatus Vogelbacteria bacterium]